MAKKVQPLERIDANPRFAAAASVMRAIESGLGRLDADADAVRVSEDLRLNPSDPRAEVLDERLKRHRNAAPKAAEPAQSSSEMPAPVRQALELLQGGERPRRVNRQAELTQLADDRDVLREGIIAAQSIVDAIRDELSAEVARRLVAEHRALVLSKFRAAQTLAAATDAERELFRSITEAGYVFRPDLMPSPGLRAALVLGSEADHDSDVSRARRALEEAGIL